MIQSALINPEFNSVDHRPSLTLIKDGQHPVRRNKDGSLDRRRCHKQAGKSSEVYAFKSESEINAMNAVFDYRIAHAYGEDRHMEQRNKLLFNIGINIGLRASDLCSLKWSFFFEDETLMVKDHEALIPKKQRKTGKYVKIFCNSNVIKILDQYIEEYPVDDLDSYIFYSRKTGNPIEEKSLWRIIKTAAKEAGIKQNIGSHSLRKTFGYWVWHLAADKNDALVKLQYIFRHDNPITTMRYIGIYDNDLRDTFESLNFGEGYLS